MTDIVDACTKFRCPLCGCTVIVYHLYDNDAGEGCGCECCNCDADMEEVYPDVPA